MKKTCRLVLLSSCLLALPCTVPAAEVSVDSATILRVESRDVTSGTKRTLLPATQFLGLDVDKLADGNLSLHLNGWGRYDLADKSYNDEKGDGSLTYGYLQYRFNTANADIRAGRFFVHEGIVNEQIDGVSLRSDLPLGFGFSAFGGANVHTKNLVGENSDGKGDGNFGGRINYRYKGVLELGASGQYETDAPRLINHTTADNRLVNHRLVGGDVWFSPHKSVELMGHTSYNTVTKGVAEQSALMNIKPLQHLVLTGEYNEHRERNYFYTWVTFTNLLNPDERSRSLGGSASYEFSKRVEVAADYKRYTRVFGNADRFGADIKLSFLDNAARSGLSYHFVRAGNGFAIAGINPNASYHELRAYAMHDTKTYFGSVDVIDYIFREKISNERSAWEAMASVGYHLTPALAISGDISYGRDPQFTEQIKGLVRLTYNMTYDSKGGKK